jgi:ketose-bisphosphate aldolase
MKLINGYQLMEYARKNNYVLPAFNTINLEITYAIAKGLSAANLPGYIQISSNNLRLSNPSVITKLAQDAVKGTATPIGLHLDHGKSFADVKACVEAGVTSIMVDASHLPFEENIREVRRTVEYCHFYGLPVEAELGALQGKEDDMTSEADSKTDPDMVADFIEQTGCDLLAVSVGNVHGLCLEPRIDIPLLKRICEVSKVPLVMHGGSGIPPDVIGEAKKYGLIKINYGSDLRQTFISTFGKAYEQNHNEYDVIHISLEAVENVAHKVQELVTMINRC